MNLFDLFVLTLALVFLIWGFLRGVVRGIFSLLSLVLGFAAAGRGYKEVAGILSAHMNSSAMASLFSFLLIFAVVSLGSIFLGRLIRRLVHRTDLATVDRLLGAALGMAMGIFLAMVITVTLVFFLPRTPAILLHSTLSPFLVQLGDLSLRVAPSDLRQVAKKKNAAFLTQVADRPSSRPQAHGEHKR